MIQQRVINIILNSLTPEQIYLIGYGVQSRPYINIFHSHTIEHIPYKISHIDILIIGIQPTPNTIAEIAISLRNFVHCTVMIIDPSIFNQYLKQGAYLALRAVEYGKLLFERTNTPIVKPNFSVSDSLKLEAEKSAAHIYNSAEEFWRCSQLYRPSKNNFHSLSLYFLRQAFDLYLRSGIMGTLGIELEPETKTWRLMQIARWTHPAIAKLLSLNKKPNQAVKNCFEAAYSHILFDRNCLIEIE